MSDQDHDALIAQFISTTGCDDNRARFYLELAKWDIQPALEAYFDSEMSENAEDVNMEDAVSSRAREQSSRGPSGTPAISGLPGNTPGTGPFSIPSSKDPKKKTAPSGNARIRTFNDIRGKEESDDSDDHSDDREEQEFYVGSGQEVIGPGKKKKDPDSIIANMFKAARQHGAEQVEDPNQVGPSRGRPGAQVFGSGGFRLGDSNVPSQPTSNETPSGGGRSANQVAVEPNPPVALRMWRNGFTVDDGPLRRYDDPANAEFMDSVKQGRVPLELVTAARGRELRVQMEDKREQEYTEPKRPKEYFTGTGHMLGSPAPAVVSTNAPKGPTSAASSDSDKKKAEDQAKQAVAFDSSQPSTNIQIRLGDGTRLVHRFNETNTISDIRRFIRAARPDYASQDFQLLSGFPSKPLTEDNVSLKDANLLNAAISVK